MNMLLPKRKKKSIDSYYSEPLPKTSPKDVHHYSDVKVHIQQDIQTQEEKLEDATLTTTKIDRINREIVRLEKLDQLADLRIKMLEDPKNAEKYHEVGVKIMDTIIEEYKDVIVESLPQTPDSEIKQVFHVNTYVDTDPVYRYHCDAEQNLPGWFDADVDTHYPTGSDWDGTWHYPIDMTNSGDPTCDEYDHAYNGVTIYGPYPFSCSHNTSSEDFADDFYCSSINHSTSVGIYANAKYYIGATPYWYATNSWDVEYLN